MFSVTAHYVPNSVSPNADVWGGIPEVEIIVFRFVIVKVANRVIGIQVSGEALMSVVCPFSAKNHTRPSVGFLSPD